MALNSANMKLGLLMSLQAQKHLTLNRSLCALDQLAQLRFKSSAQHSPPLDIQDGDSILVSATPTGEFKDYADHIALYFSGSNHFTPPVIGWLAYFIQDGSLRV